MREIKVDSRRNAFLASLRGSEATEAIHKAPKADSREAYFASAKFMDRHALQSKARDDRKRSINA